MLRHLLLFTLLAGLAAGCASRPANPVAARPGRGYVDFRTDPADDLAWQVSQFDAGKQAWQQVFSSLTPPAGGVLRLSCPPGPYAFQVTFLNRVVVQPAQVQVEVVDGLVTPVVVTLTPAGTMGVDQKQTTRLGTTVKSTYGQRSKYNGDQSTAWQVEARAIPPITYHPLP